MARHTLRTMLLSWWVIPGSWLVVFPILWLFDGGDAYACMKEYSLTIWYGS